MKKLCLILIQVFTFLSFTNAKETSRISLITSQCKENEGICDTQQIVKYKFNNGEFQNKEVLLSSDTEAIRFDLGGNFIYQNRLIITSSGDIFDLTNKTILFKSKGDLVEIFGNKFITKVNRTDDEGYYSFNLITQKNEKIRKLKEFPNLSAYRFSPNKNLFAEWKRNRFVFYQVDTKPKLKKIKEVFGEFSASCSVRCSEFAKVDLVWLDNENIITQRQNGEILKVNLKGKIEPVTKITLEGEPDSSPSF